MRKLCVPAIGLFFLLGLTQSLSKDEPPPDEPPTVKLPLPYGTIQGLIRKTSGVKNEYKVFRNIPYAEPIDSTTRWTQSKMFKGSNDPLGTDAKPYDAKKAGPMCPQKLSDNLKLNNVEVIKNYLKQFGSATTDDPTAKKMLKVLKKLYNREEDLETLTYSETIGKWLDMDYKTSEDCLHLTVSTPNKEPPTKDGFPVMFYIHGGGFSSGNHLSNEADRLGDAADVVVVGVNYRLGITGFLCLDSDKSAGNQGMLDVVLALEWVKKYISKFNGNPKLVTIFGESAGSAAVGHMLLSPATRYKRLFKYAIGQSGSPIASWAFNQKSREYAIEFANKMNCDVTMGDDAIVECLKKIKLDKLIDEYSKFTGELYEKKIVLPSLCPQTKGERQFYGPKDNPRDILLTGKYNRASIFFGSNLNEGVFLYNNLYNRLLKPNGYDQVDDASAKYYKNKLIGDMNHVYGITNGYTLKSLIAKEYFKDKMDTLESVVPGIIDYAGAQVIKAPSYEMMSRHVQHTKYPAYWYSFEYEGGKSLSHAYAPGYEAPFTSKYQGANHGDELLLLFNYEYPLILCDIKKLYEKYDTYLKTCSIPGQTDDQIITCVVTELRNNDGECVDGKLTVKDKAMSDVLTKAWTNFAINGNPNVNDKHDKLESWTKENPVYVAYNEKTTIEKDYTEKYIIGKKP